MLHFHYPFQLSSEVVIPLCRLVLGNSGQRALNQYLMKALMCTPQVAASVPSLTRISAVPTFSYVSMYIYLHLGEQGLKGSGKCLSDG